MLMDKCVATIKTGPRKGAKCGARKKLIDIVNGEEKPHCNRHKIKKINNNIVNELSENLDKKLYIEKKENFDFIQEENIEDNDFNNQNTLKKIDKQLDKLFKEYGL